MTDGEFSICGREGLEANDDVLQAGVSAETHYHTYGWKEGRNPDALFLGYPYAEGPAYGCG